MGNHASRTSGSVAKDDYLEQILNLIEEKGYARPVDISQRLGISQASVTNMLQRLDSEGLVKHEKYRGTALTPQGEQIAKAIIDRHELLTEFLRIFDIDEDTIYRDVEGWSITSRERPSAHCGLLLKPSERLPNFASRPSRDSANSSNHLVLSHPTITALSILLRLT